uniref:EGF-like domain-containing protein n=1 Tax=Callorhinchus milii TaxID=7868 RepID=A0A4W3IKF2_CALMI
MKPVCAPPCQNRGSCSRPQVCVCRSGFQGSRCEEVVPEQHYISHRRAISSRLFSSSLSGSYLNMVHRIEKRTKNNTKSIGETSSTTRHKTSTGDESQGSETQSRSRQQTNSQQLLGTSRTVKHVSNRNGLLLSNALPNANTQTQSNNRFTANGQRSTNYHNAQARGKYVVIPFAFIIDVY